MIESHSSRIGQQLFRWTVLLAGTCVLTACLTPVNLKVPSYPSKLDVGVSNVDAPKIDGPKGSEYDVPESQVRYMNWSVLNRRWLNVDYILGRIGRAVRDDLGDGTESLKGVMFNPIFTASFADALKDETSADGIRLVPQVGGKGVTLFTVARLSLGSGEGAGLEFQLAARDASGSSKDGLNRNFFYVTSDYKPLRSNGAGWLDNQGALIKAKAAVAYQHLARLYLREITGKLGAGPDESKLRKVAWPSAVRPGDQDYGYLVETSGPLVFVIRIHDDNGRVSRDWGIVERKQ